MSEIPRRCRVDLMTPAELAIRAAIDAVEELPADARLSEAVVLLGEARENVADYVDGKQALSTRFDASLVCFLYILLRDYLPAGAAEEIMRDHVDKIADMRVTFSNHFLAEYAREVAERLTTERVS